MSTELVCRFSIDFKDKGVSPYVADVLVGHFDLLLACMNKGLITREEYETYLDKAHVVKALYEFKE